MLAEPLGGVLGPHIWRPLTSSHPISKPTEAESEGARPRTMCFKQASWGARCRWPSAGRLFPAHGGWFSRPSSSSRWGEGHVCHGSSLSEARGPSSPPGRWEQGGVWAGGKRQGATCGRTVEGLTLSSSGLLTPPAGGLRGFLHLTLPLGPLDSFPL